MPTDTKLFLDAEARALWTRLDRLVPFTVSTPMVPAANVPPAALAAVEGLLRRGRQRLRASLARFLAWLRSPAGRRAPDAEAQRRFVVIRIAFHSNIARFDLFADVLVQRSEHETGVWVAGLDDFAADALRVPGVSVPAPPMMCYLDRGIGAAIRRARTRLPGGDLSPVAVIRVPRERMIGKGIGSSLVHEVGHQAAAVFDILPPLRAALVRQARAAANPLRKAAWVCWGQWCSELVSDLWAVAYLGPSATLGLMGVVSLPRAFVFRFEPAGPHPFPYIRVLASAALGQALYPDPQWRRLAAMWAAMYPPAGLAPELGLLTAELTATLGDFAAVTLGLRLPAFGGRPLGERLGRLGRSPRRLAAVWQAIRHRRDDWHRLPPTLSLAAIGQARSEGRLTPEGESEAISRLLKERAVRNALDATGGCRQVVQAPPVTANGSRPVRPLPRLLTV